MSVKTETATKELSKGAQWMIDRIDAMQADYRVSATLATFSDRHRPCIREAADVKEALMAAVTIIQYQTHAQKL